MQSSRFCFFHGYRAPRRTNGNHDHHPAPCAPLPLVQRMRYIAGTSRISEISGRSTCMFTGIITAMMKKSKHTESGGLSSKAGWFGLAKKVCTLMLIVVAVRMDILLNTNYIRDAVCISFCLNELLSIVENTSLMGIPYPPAIKKAIDVLQTKIGRTEETTDKEDK